MATPLSADAMVRALKNEGVPVEEYRSWRTHNRNHKGAWGGVNGVMIHHTVSSGESSSVALCYNGHATLPGPLCHAVGGKSGKVYLVSSGRANHAGNGDDDVLDAVINESGNLPADNEANTDGNRRFYGIEIVNLGNGRDEYTAKQYDSAVRWAAGICRAHGWSAASVIGHKEWQPGKIDPHGPVEGQGNFDMDTFRADVQRRLDGSASAGATSNENGDDMPEYVSLTTSKDYTLAPNAWDSIEWDNEYADDRDEHYMPGGSQFVHGPALYAGTASLTLANVDVGATVQMRVYEIDRASGKTVSNGPIMEFLGTGGNTYCNFSFTDTLGKGHGARIRMVHTSSAPITIKHATLKCFAWKR